MVTGLVTVNGNQRRSKKPEDGTGSIGMLKATEAGFSNNGKKAHVEKDSSFCVA